MSRILDIERLHKRFGAVVIAHGLDFAVQAGEAVGILGPNGAGKSTLFGMITGTVAPDSGRVAFEGDDVTRLPPNGAAARGSPARSRCRSRSAI